MHNKKTYKFIFCIISLASLCSCEVYRNEYPDTYWLTIRDNSFELYTGPSTADEVIDEISVYGNDSAGIDGLNFDRAYNKLYAEYHVTRETNENRIYDFLYDSDSFVYDCENSISYAYKTSSEEINIRAYEITNFLNETFKKIENEKYNYPSRQPFTLLGVHNFTYTDKPYFLMNTSTYLWKYRLNDNSSFYILESDTDFIPGCEAGKYNSDYIVNWRNFNNQITIIPHTLFKTIYYCSSGSDYCIPFDKREVESGRIIRDETFPLVDAEASIITKNDEITLPLGYSFLNGFDFEYNYSLNNKSYGEDPVFPYSKTYNKENPKLFYSIDIFNSEPTWLYSYEYPTKISNHTKSYYIFSMFNDSYFLESEMLFEIQYNFEVSTGVQYHSSAYNNYAYFSNKPDRNYSNSSNVYSMK